ncbi:MAG: hypothetical protein V4675_16935 [Verrucomicrobiota bacterium]
MRTTFKNLSLWLATIFCTTIGYAEAGPPVPPPYTVTEMQALLEQITTIGSQKTGTDLKDNIKKFIDQKMMERAKAYEGATIRITTEKAAASMGTHIDFKTERKEIRFTIQAPFPGMRIAGYAPAPQFEMTRGSSRRVVANPVNGINETSTEVPFHLTLIEPNGTENDVRVLYSGWAEFSFTPQAALAAAQRDVQPLRDQAEKLPLSPPEILVKSEVIVAAETKNRDQTISPQLQGDNSADHQFIGNIISGIIVGLILPPLNTRIRILWRRICKWWKKGKSQISEKTASAID